MNLSLLLIEPLLLALGESDLVTHIIELGLNEEDAAKVAAVNAKHAASEAATALGQTKLAAIADAWDDEALALALLARRIFRRRMSKSMATDHPKLAFDVGDVEGRLPRLVQQAMRLARHPHRLRAGEGGEPAEGNETATEG